MNYIIPNLPERSAKPRINGLTMVMDKGLSLRQAEDLVAVASDYIDFVKLGWSTSYLTPQLTEKINLYQQAGLHVFFGGTLLEVFIIRNAFDQYRKLLDQYGLTHVEVSSGSIDMSIEQKIGYISQLKNDFVVLSEVGSKDSNKVMAPYLWVEHILAELEAGSSIVITESRESGTVGIFRPTGEIRSGLIDEILHRVSPDKLLFEAPNKVQQTWFIKLLGTNVNLGNIDPNEVIGLETLRLGLRGDTFFMMYDKE
jgi:phosphosulfolactate synthase